VSYNPNYPFVSVVIVNFNGVAVLSPCLKSLVLTDYPNFDIIVVDNGSSDGSVNVLEEFRRQSEKRITVIKNSCNMGFAEANNIGVKSSSCKYVALLNNDTVVDENWLRTLVNTLEENPGIGAVQSLLLKNADVVDSVGAAMDIFGTACDIVVPFYQLSLYRSQNEIFSACAASMLVRKDLFERVGGFDSKFFAYFEDVDLSWRIRLNGYRIVIDVTSIVYHFRGTTSKKFKGNLFDFHLYKNQIAMLIKNHSLKCLVMVTPIVCLLYLFRVANGVMKRNSGLVTATLKAILWNIIELPYLMSQRKYVNKYVRRVSDHQIRGCMSKRLMQLWSR